jgi:hypothetical protein
MPFEPFSDEQARIQVNLAQRYSSWMAAERALGALPYDLRRKEITGKQYLYQIDDRNGNGKSLGPMTPKNEATLAQYRQDKAATKSRRDASALALQETCLMYRALRLPLLASQAGQILRESDKRRLLGSQLLVVGTNAMIAYAVEAGGFIRDAPDETDDFDLAWTAIDQNEYLQPVWAMLKAVDKTYTINTERSFQARNAKAYEVDLLVAPSRADSMSPKDQPRPIPLPEQEWLLNGTAVDHIVVCRDGSPARVVAPDPRWYALHKLWMADQPKRNPLKRPKDAKQGTALLNAIWAMMPQYPLNVDFEAALPSELFAYYEHWKAKRAAKPLPNWQA